MIIPSILNGWTELELLSNQELLELANHLDNLKQAKILHPDEQIAFEQLKRFDSFVHGLRNQYRKRVIFLIK